MSVIDKLKDKIDTLQSRYRAIERENIELKSRIVEIEEELLKYKEGDVGEVEALKELLKKKDEKIAELEKEMSIKDEEIEAIITKVEALIGVEGNYY